jgi:hypothetical protein
VADEQRALAANLLLERVELKRDMAAIKSDLAKRADSFVKLGTLLRSNPFVIAVDDQSVSDEYAPRVQRFTSDDFNAKRIGDLSDELRTKTERLNAVEQQIRAMGYPLE